MTDAYASRAAEYIDLFGSADLASAADQALIAEWSEDLDGRVLDAGCGPGHWSAFLHSRRVPVEGVDATPSFIAHARRTHPGIPFREGDLRALELAPVSLGGVLAWYSLIHLDPVEVPGVLRGFARALRSGGSLLLGFFGGDELRPFDHGVITAWAWPVEAMAAAVLDTGLELVSRAEHERPNGRRAAFVVARRPG